jgi:hypothetical protein
MNGDGGREGREGIKVTGELDADCGFENVE